MKVYFWFKKRASIPLAPCMYTVFWFNKQNEFGLVGMWAIDMEDM
jgi:hypothetical protein